MKRLIAKMLSAIMVISLMPVYVSAEDTEAQVLYEEHFEDSSIQADIEEKLHGWGCDCSDPQMISDKKLKYDITSDHGYTGGGNFLRFGIDAWYKNAWTTLDLEENGVYKRTQAGETEAAAKEAVADYLSKNMSVSFKAKFEVETSGYNTTELPHEAYIRIKNNDYAAIAEIRMISDNTPGSAELMLRALDAGGNALEDYKIKDIDFSKENTDWHDFNIDIDVTDNTYRVTVDGEVFKGTPYGEWIPAAKGDDDKNAVKCSVDKIQSLEIGDKWSGWWQAIGMDDLVITEGKWNSDKPVVSPSASITPVETPDANVDYIEDFDNAGTEQIIKEQKNGWSYDGTDDSPSHIELWVGDNGSGSKNSLRFASNTWYKTMWLIMNFKDDMVSKQIASGKSEQAAEIELSQYLSGDFKLSFDVRFEQQGTDSNDTHEQYIRIKGSDNHAITELHLYNNTLGIIALNSDKTSNEFYEIKNINWNSGNREWHNFTIYFDHTRDSYMVEVDGDVFRGTSHGRWIPGGSESGISSSEPAPLGEITTLEFGHYWSAYWQNMSIDNVVLSKYEPIEDVYEIGNLTIKNEHGGTVLTKGSSYSADVSATGGETADTKLVWEYSADNRITWLPLTQNTVPGDATHIRVTATCTSIDNQTAEDTVEAEIAKSGTVDYVEIVSENFEASEKETEILNQKNGWSIKGQSNQVKIGTGFGGTRNSLRFASTASNVTNNLRLDFVKRGAVFESNDRLYLKLDYSFGLGSSEDTVNSASLAYIRIKDTNNNAFTTVSLLGDKMYMSYYDPEEQKNKQAVIAQGQSIVLDTWRTMELYLDTEKNKYCMLIDGKAVGPEGMKWFTPSDTIVTGIGKPNAVTGIGAVEIGQENSAWWENTCVDNISLQRYYLPSGSTLNVNGIQLFNGYDSAKPLVTGGSVREVPDVDESTVIADAVYSREYYDGSVWEIMTGDKIPEDAERIRVSGEFTDVYGQTATASGEAEVSKNSAPVISELNVKGKVESGQILKPEYKYSDTENNADDSIFIWSQSRSADGKYKEVSREKEYTVTDKDVGSYMMLTVIPRDDYGACGAALEYSVDEGETSLFSRVWKKISIPSEPSGNTVYLPDRDEEYGVSFIWSSSDASLLSSNGVINRPLYGYKTVTLTAVASDGDGNISRKSYTVTITGAAGSASSGGGGGGGGGGGSSSASGSVRTASIPHAVAAPIVKWTDNENDSDSGGGSGSIVVNRYFNDVNGSEWYASNVFALKDKGIVSGDENGDFRPDSFITRAEFVKMIVDLMGIRDDSADCDFSDVLKAAWYYPYVASALKFNIISGMGDGKFGTELNITRQDIAVIAAAAIEMARDADSSGDLSEFSDAADIADYAADSVRKMSNAEIMKGSDGLFRPRDNATRAEAARVVYMIDQYLSKSVSE